MRKCFQTSMYITKTYSVLISSNYMFTTYLFFFNSLHVGARMLESGLRTCISTTSIVLTTSAL